MPLYLELIFAFSILGLVDTIYLSYHAITKTDVKCLFFPVEWCKKVQYSTYSKTFGIPNPYLGLCMYLAIIFFGLLFWNGLAPFWFITTIVTIGFLFSAYFTYIQAFVLKAFCTWCVVSAINFLVMFVAVYFVR